MVFIRWSGRAHFSRFQMVPQWWTMPMWLWPRPDWLQQTNAMSFLQEEQHWHLTIQSQHSQPLLLLLRVGKSDNRGHVALLLAIIEVAKLALTHTFGQISATNSKDMIFIDEIYRYLIFKRVAAIWNKSSQRLPNTPICQHQWMPC